MPADATTPIELPIIIITKKDKFTSTPWIDIGAPYLIICEVKVLWNFILFLENSKGTPFLFINIKDKITLIAWANTVA